MATRKNNKTFKKKIRKNKSRKGGANECERLPFSRLSYDELHNNYQKYCTNIIDKNFKNKNCCLTLETKFKNWTTDGRDFDNVTENYENDEQYNKINNITEDNSFTPETFIRASQGGKYKKKSKKKTRKLRK
jgi:hypothetical protein